MEGKFIILAVFVQSENSSEELCVKLTERPPIKWKKYNKHHLKTSVSCTVCISNDDRCNFTVDKWVKKKVK